VSTRDSAKNVEFVTRWKTARRAERVLVNGRLVHPHAPTHGENSTYNNYGCHCGPCEEAHSEAMQAYRAARLQFAAGLGVGSDRDEGD
jgi:hypothetical protein